jgi:hypothetical protein
MEALRKSGWAWQVPVPTFFSVQGPQSLGNSFVPMVYEPLAFCIGVVLLFSRERHRQAGPLDWSRRWGVITSYLVMLLGIVQVAFITSLVMVGIGALFQSMPRAYQPRLTSLFVEAGAGYIHYGLQPSGLSLAALAGLSSTAILLACVPLFNALRSCGSQVWAAILLGLLALAAITQGGSAGMYMLGLLPRARAEEWLHERSFYFAPTLLVAGLADLGWSSFSRAFLVEVVKWLTCLVIATWLCIAQLRAAGTRRRLAAS